MRAGVAGGDRCNAGGRQRAPQAAISGQRAHVASITYVPTWDRRTDYTVIPIDIGLARHQAPVDVLRASYYRTTSTVGRIPHLVYPMPAHIH